MVSSNDESRGGLSRTPAVLSIGRIGVGISLLGATRLTLALLKDVEGISEEGVTFARLFGGRDLIQGIGTLQAFLRGSPARRSWIVGGMASDALDAYCFWKDHSMGTGMRLFMTSVALGAVGMGALILSKL